jgi:hypothetical protein
MRANTVERRTELLKMEGLGFSESEIVTELSQKYHVDPRSIYRDFESRTRWQLSPDAHAHYLKAFNRLEQIFRKAAAIYLTNNNNANAQIGAIRVMADIAIKQIDLSGYTPTGIGSDGVELSWKDSEENQRLERAIEKKVEANMTEQEKETLVKYARLFWKFKREFEQHPELIRGSESIH